MKDYTINEAREIITKYFDKISDEHKQNNYGCSCLGIECRDCLFYDSKYDIAKKWINDKISNGEDWNSIDFCFTNSEEEILTMLENKEIEP